VLIVSYNTRALLLEAIASVVDEPDVETIVVDNNSRDGSAAAVAERFPRVRLIACQDNPGFAGGVNRGASQARGAALLVLNADARLAPGALDRLLELLDARPRAALVSPTLQYPDGRPQSSAFRIPGLTQVLLDLLPVDRLMESGVNGRLADNGRPREIEHPLGACMLIRRTAWADVGAFDEGYFMYLEEIDWCRRAQRRGWQIWQEPRAIAIHHGGSSTSQQPDAMFAQLWRSRLRYYQRFSGPTYNRAIHAVVRWGLGRRPRRQSPRVDAVRRLAE
jgi:GT2 family glycosyltransferase